MRCNSPKSAVHNAQLAADEAAIAAAIVAAETFSDAIGCVGEWRARLLILIEELVANLVDHGSLPIGSKIGLSLVLTEEAIRFELVESGLPFDPRGAAPDDADLPPDEGGGAGLRLLAAWAHIVDYASADGINRLLVDVPAPASR